MEENKYNIDDIENFLNQEMDAAELAAFEKELAADTQLAAEVDLHDDVVKGIQTAGPIAFLEMVAGVHSEMKEEGFFLEKEEAKQAETSVQQEAKVRSISMFRRLAIAASFALLLVAGWWVFSSQPTTPDQLFANNFSVPQDLLSIEIEDRLAETGFGTNKEVLNNLQTAINTYNSGNYEQSISQLNTFQTAAPTDALSTYAAFYKAVALLQTGQENAALTELLLLSQQANFPLQNDAKWYLALTYLKQGNGTAAKPLLQALSTVDTYKKQAVEILRNL